MLRDMISLFRDFNVLHHIIIHILYAQVPKSPSAHKPKTPKSNCPGAQLAVAQMHQCCKHLVHRGLYIFKPAIALMQFVV
jgi:hypothetical protein